MEPNPYAAAKGVEYQSAARGHAAWIRTLIFAVLAGICGLIALFSLWAAMYWHWESTRQLPVAEVEQATYDYHVWLFFCIVFGIGCLAFSVVAVVSSILGPRHSGQH